MTGKLPDALVACVGGSNAIGLFHPFLADHDVAMYGVEAGGKGVRVLENTQHLSVQAFPACYTAIVPILCRTRTGKSCTRTLFRQALIMQALAQSTLG